LALRSVPRSARLSERSAPLSERLRHVPYDGFKTTCRTTGRNRTKKAETMCGWRRASVQEATFLKILNSFKENALRMLYRENRSRCMVCLLGVQGSFWDDGLRFRDEGVSVAVQCVEVCLGFRPPRRFVQCGKMKLAQKLTRRRRSRRGARYA